MTLQSAAEMHLKLGPWTDNDDAYPFIVEGQIGCLPALLAVRRDEALSEHLALHKSEILQYFKVDRDKLRKAREQYGAYVSLFHAVRVKHENQNDIVDVWRFLQSTSELAGVGMDTSYAFPTAKIKLVYQPASI
jgi:hypothetical protein